MANIYTPNGKESIRHINSTPEDRAKHREQFREQKDFEQKNKDERFAKIREDRKKRPSGGNGINIEVTKGDQ
jgi:hypothetical protein